MWQRSQGYLKENWGNISEVVLHNGIFMSKHIVVVCLFFFLIVANPVRFELNSARRTTKKLMGHLQLITTSPDVKYNHNTGKNRKTVATV